MSSGLYGIEHSNRSVDDHWGKNCFNSSFPAATASYMMEHDITAIYIHLDIVKGKPTVVASEIPVRDVFKCGASMQRNYILPSKVSMNLIRNIHLIL